VNFFYLRRHNAGFITSSSTPPARLKPDPLGQGQFSSPIDGIGLAAHIGLPGIRTRLASAARLFLTTEGPANLRTRGPHIDIRDPTV
jgi:hypothetical protein